MNPLKSRRGQKKEREIPPEKKITRTHITHFEKLHGIFTRTIHERGIEDFEAKCAKQV